ncbi:translocon-associated protein subunit beta, partial [Clarias magur]
MEMVVIGAVDNFPCEAFDQELVLLLCEDGNIYAYEDEVLHLVARNVKELFETGLTFPGLECYKMGECFEDPMRALCVFAVFASLALAVMGEEGARLLASKSLLNRYAVEGRDLTLQYNIYNVGTSAALEVELSGDSFPPEDFAIVSGMLNVKASNASHTVVLRPLKAGYFNFTKATVSYLAQEGGQVVVGYTSAPGQGGILAQREFDRRFSPHY